ncbi:MAG: UDP-N-acetylmuramyl-tripeptide synthetase [Treponema sp.]|uniref:Mur ligase family protein n=1 Tax=Treponema sp. TaxID=166 RepID=UPI0025F27175|nr:UDP-N-acetylmuramyl-tripeptide synthetase [Treponema sp.]MBQ8678483.1 UDP-N-acetylmuramyl-tripeptide synthetase [Treponema sp.]
MTKNLFDTLSSIKYTIVASDGKTPLSQKDTPNPEISSLVFDSRDVKPGSLFFALPGTHTTGNVFIPKAIENGASAIVFEGELSLSSEQLAVSNSQGKAFPSLQPASLSSATPSAGSNPAMPPVFIRVENARKVMAPVAAQFYDNPSSKLGIIGVTGTEGKSSTVSFVWQLLRLTGHKAGFISTVQYSLGDEAIANPQHQTTPEATIIQRQLYEMVENGCEYAVVETSSHGLSPKLNRTGNLLFDCGIFMNVTLEHLEFHGTFEQYRDDKANLFRKLDEHNHEKTILGKKVTVPSFGIVNLEDPSAEYFIKATKQPVLGFTTEGKAGKSAAEGAEAAPLPKIPDSIPVLLGRNIASARFGLTFDMTEPHVIGKDSKPLPPKVFHVKSSLPGAFNTYNLMAAIEAVSRLTGTDIEKVASMVEQLVPVKGRMTVIDKGQPFELIVDYAHTPSSFETIFPPLRRRCSGKMISLFGSGGERDTKKRPLQGEIAARFCDIVILTDEDPRGEDSVELLKDIAVGAEKAGKIMGKDLFITPDRPAAIRQAFKMAGKDDIVLLLGKAHENSIIYKDRVMPYDEIAEAEKALGEIL